MAFNIATNNRFDLFVEEDNIEDADELLTRQQRQAREGVGKMRLLRLRLVRLGQRVYCV